VDLSLVVSCAPVTAKGVKSVTAAVLSATSNCGYADTSAYEITYRCKEGKEKFDKLEDVVRKACAVADHPGSAAPVFVANKGWSTFDIDEFAGTNPGENDRCRWHEESLVESIVTRAGTDGD
jgi:hypothetical protein